jgi:hypothetical protein
MIDQSAKGARADILAANETQPIESLGVGQLYAAARGGCHGFTAD